MSLGISPMIAVVLLVALTVGVGGLLGVWMQGSFQSTAGEVSSSTESSITCSATTLNVMSASRNCSQVSLVLQNSGPAVLDGLNILLTDGDRAVNATYSGTISSGQAVVVSMDITPSASSGLLQKPSDIHITSPTCPNLNVRKSAISSVSAQSGMSDIGSFCVDSYEASRSDATSGSAGSSSIASSRQGVVPWASITQTAARTACEAAGKHLCSNMEWQLATGTLPESTACTNGNNAHTNDATTYYDCVDDPTYDWGTAGGTDRCLTGTNSTWCNSNGVCDLNGNVWEWVDDFYGQGSQCDLGSNGNVNGWDWVYNCPTSLGSNSTYGYDYYWYPDAAGDGAVIRGGLWNLGGRAGCFALDLYNPPLGSYAGIGFRCCL